jgi:hypothetical protein
MVQMKRRKFIFQLLSAGTLAGMPASLFIKSYSPENDLQIDLYDLFKNPDLSYHPFVRWWWNGNKVEEQELIRELRLLKEAGIGGVEINPIEFPTRFEGDDLGKPSLEWLSREWTGMLKIVFDESKKLGLTCDLIVGSGWPFGGEFIKPEKRLQIVVIAVKKLTGPVDYEVSKYELFREADPAVSSPFPGRTMELMSVHLVPDPLSDLAQAKELKIEGSETIRISVPPGRHAIYGVVKIAGFMQVIDGAPGAKGPVLNHYDRNAVKEYLLRMSGKIESITGSLKNNIRALFTDSMELEGANWTNGIAEEFMNRRGYDLMPYLPFILFRTGAMGNVTDFSYGVKLTPGTDSELRRVRYDFELTKAELLRENFIEPFTAWCSGLGVKSRAQAYGRSFFPLESSMHYDIPECESWTMNWLKHRIGEEMPEDDYRRGRAYTMVNKYVSSAANLSGRRLVSCEEMTDTYTVFNTSLENLKVGGDQSAVTGVTHSVFHGFNYSPPEAPYPGWIRYGCYYNENNTWWPWFNLYTEYKGRLSAAFSNSDMFTDIAILPPMEDMWSIIGSQMEPFPSILHAEYLSLIWEAMNKNGHGCDYISQSIIRKSGIKNGTLVSGPKRYKLLFMVQVESLEPEAAEKILEFIISGGKVFCIETTPDRAPGLNDHESRDAKIRNLVGRMKQFPDRFIHVKKPVKDFISWFRELRDTYGINPYLNFSHTDPYLMQVRRRADDGTELIWVIHSHLHKSHLTRIIFSREVTNGKQGWIWDPVDGRRFRIKTGKDNGTDLDLGPASSFLFVFDRNKGGEQWVPEPVTGEDEVVLSEGWSAEFRHCHNITVMQYEFGSLTDLKEIPEFVSFAGTVKYRNKFRINISGTQNYINLGKVWGVCSLRVNGTECGSKLAGRRIFRVGKLLRKGENEIEILVATSMGNYMKSLTDNPIAQYWTNEKNKVQPIQSMGLIGPVTLYSYPSSKIQG